MPLKCVLDCDPGHDDAIAIALATYLPELDVRAITTVAGNGTLDQTTLNARRVATLLGLSIPIAAGAAQPLRRALITAPDVHGESALDGAKLPDPSTPVDPRPALELLLDVLREDDEETTVIATGPLTNVAILLRDGREAAGRIREIVLMGGSTERGNVTPAAEFNIYVDPEAAHSVFESGVPLRMAGLNLTHQAIATDEIQRRMRAVDSELARVIADWTDFFTETYRALYGFEGAPIHDACAVAWAAHPDIVESGEYFVDVELGGRWTRGATVVDVHRRLGQVPNARVGLTLDTARFWQLVISALHAGRQQIASDLHDPPGLRRSCAADAAVTGADAFAPSVGD